jgi:hypothetical protein
MRLVEGGRYRGKNAGEVIAFVGGSAEDDRGDSADVADVLEQVGIEQHEVRDPAGLDGADRIGDAERLR